MAKHAVRLLCKLSIFNFFVFFIEMSSAASVPRISNIIDIIKSDENLQCTLPQSVYNNSIIKDCYNLKYPEKTKPVNDTNIFLCIAFHDMLYKVCSANVINQIPTDNIKFQSYIEKFYPTNGESDRFCENIKNVKFSYKELLPLLSSIHYNKTLICNIMCFDVKENFNPLCAVLAWSKQIDKDITKLNKSHQVQSQISAATNAGKTIGTSDEHINHSEIKSPLLQTSSRANVNDISAIEAQAADIKAGMVSESQSKMPENSEKISNNPGKSTKNQDQITETLSKPLENQDKMLETPDKASENIGNSPKNPDKVLGNKGSAPENPDKAPENKGTAPENPDKAPENQDNAPENQDNASENEGNVFDNEGNVPENQGNAPENNINDDEKDKKDDSDLKTSTISENTQNQENSVNPDGWNHVVDDKSLYDTNDVSDHAIDTAIMPEPEQRNIMSPYHSIRSGERSHFFTYFTVFSLISIAAYVGYHNKQKILAMVLEGRRSRSNRGRRRPSTANYRKLDCTLEEAVTSQCNANVTHVIY